MFSSISARGRQRVNVQTATPFPIQQLFVLGQSVPYLSLLLGWWLRDLWCIWGEGMG